MIILFHLIVCITSIFFCSLRVSWASPHIANAEPRPRESWSQVHVTFSTPFLDLFVTEEFLEEIFSAFGTVADVTVKRHNRNTTVPPSHSGYAFVYFYELPPAARAVQRFAEMAEVNNVRLMCNLPHVIRDKHEKPFYARNESRPSGGITRGMPRPMTYNKPAGGPVPPYNYHAHHAMPPVDHYYGVPGRGPVPYGAPAEFDYGMPRKTPSQRFPGELDLGYIGRNPEFSNEMTFAAEKRRGDVPQNGWHSPSSAPPSREALMSANAQNSGELSLGSWSSLSHSNSLNFTGSSTPIGQQHKSIVPPSDGLLSFNAPVVPGSYKVTPPGAEDGIAGVNSLGSFPMNLDNLQPLEG